MLYSVPKLWTETVQTHRREVREAILDATSELVLSRGLLAVTMSDIAEATGIGRATLYKYFPDVEAILNAWHQRQVEAHLAELAHIRQGAGDAATRLEAVLRTYALICRKRRRHGGEELAAVLHRSPEAGKLQRQLLDLISGLVAEAAEAGAVRRDLSADEMASYCIHALTAAGEASSSAAVDRLVDVVWAGMTATSRATTRSTAADTAAKGISEPSKPKSSTMLNQ
jgi:AcrR family transcriptional regulator